MEVIGECLRLKGDVIITDPVYFIAPEENWQLFCKAYDDGDKEPLKQFGIEPAIVIHSEEIDCKVYDDKEQRIGRFCSDSALICVCLLEDVLKHNTDYNDFNEEYTKSSVTVIRGFDGEIEVHEVSEEENEYCDFTIVGKGNVNFRTE